MDATWPKVPDEPRNNNSKPSRIFWANVATGTIIEGTYQGLCPAAHGQGEDVMLETPSGLMDASAGAILSKKLSRIPLGTPIAIQYLGTVESKNGGHPYRTFDVFHDPSVVLLPKARTSAKSKPAATPTESVMDRESSEVPF